MSKEQPDTTRQRENIMVYLVAGENDGDENDGIRVFKSKTDADHSDPLLIKANPAVPCELKGAEGTVVPKKVWVLYSKTYSIYPMFAFVEEWWARGELQAQKQHQIEMDQEDEEDFCLAEIEVE
jgi:hypothetical protein